MRYRRHRYGPDELMSKLERQVNARKHVGVPHAYMGNVVSKAQTVLSVTNVVSKSVGETASHFRRSLQPEPSTERRMRETAAKLGRKPKTADLFSAPDRGHLPANVIKLSSWAQEKCCELNFGGQLGSPDAVRRPSFEAWEGLAYLMPKARDGELAVSLCLRGDDVTKLRSDEYFSSFAEFIG